jgi:hypothetical protein
MAVALNSGTDRYLTKLASRLGVVLPPDLSTCEFSKRQILTG